MNQNPRGGPGSRPHPGPGWGMSHGNNSGSNQGQMNNSNSSNNPDVSMLMDQVRQLQQQVSNMSQQGNNSGQNSGGNFEQFPQPNEQRILLVSNVPNSVASCDALFFMFERFGVVERIKILHNKRSAALIQMQTPDMAEHAVNEQHVLNRIGADIYVNFSNKVNEIKMYNNPGMPEDGLSKDFTFDRSQQHGNQFYGDFRAHPGSGGSGPFSGSGPRGPQLPPVGHDNGVCILVSCLPADMANPDSISNLFGHYGDVHKVKILHNKPDCALIQMAKPHQAALCRQFLDQVKIEGNTLCVSFSRIQGIRMPTEMGMDEEQDKQTKDFTNIRGVHRFRNHMIAAKLSKNLCSPTSMLHVANLPDDFKAVDLQKYLVESGLTITECQDCGKDGSGMALIQMGTTEEAIKAIAKFHNVTPPGHRTKNNAGLCFSFSGRKSAANGSGNKDKDNKDDRESTAEPETVDD